MVIGDRIEAPYDDSGHVAVPAGRERSPVCEFAMANTPAELEARMSKYDSEHGAGAAERICGTGAAATAAAADLTSSRCGGNRLQSTGWLRLPWALSRSCERAVLEAAEHAQALVKDLHLRVVCHDAYGKRFMKRCRVSPDAYTQMAMQLAYYRDQGQFSATYEASMTRLFKHGRTETVRPVTHESVAFVKCMEDPESSPAAKLAALQHAAERHVTQYQNAMVGKGIDRHLFALYVVSVGKEIDSPFLKAALGEPWRLSTSQQPQQQTKLWDLRDPKWAKHISPGGGFGPVADDGYGVSYMVSGEDEMFFHVSSKHSNPATDSDRFVENIFKALADIREVMTLALDQKKA